MKEEDANRKSMNRKMSDVRRKMKEDGNQNPENDNCDVAIKIDNIPGYRERHTVRPGLTGIAQIYLPQDAPRYRKFKYDLLYIKRQSFWLDIKLIFLSFWVTFRGKWETSEKKF